MPKKSTPVALRPTPERRRQAEPMPLPPDLVTGNPAPVRLTQDVVDRYLARGDLSGRTAEAAMRVRGVLERLTREPRLIGAYGDRLATASSRTQKIPDGPGEGVHRAGDVWRLLCRRMGPILSGLVTAVFCEGISARDWAARSQRHPASGIEILRIALDACADHWGLPTDDR